MPSKKKCLKSYVTPEEYSQIVKQAELAKLSISTFIQRVCLGHEVHSAVDQKAVLALLETKADLGRLGGLIKYHLSEKGDSETSRINREDLRSLLKAVENTQRLLAADFTKVTQALLQI